jgi:Family of unknown function (DUF5941)
MMTSAPGKRAVNAHCPVSDNLCRRACPDAAGRRGHRALSGVRAAHTSTAGTTGQRLCRRRHLTREWVRLSTAILTGAPVAGTSPRDGLRGDGFDVGVTGGADPATSPGGVRTAVAGEQVRTHSEGRAPRSGAPGAIPAAFGLVASVAYHLYDTVYRIRGGTGAPLRGPVRAAGGHEGRLFVLTVPAVLLAARTTSTTAPAVLAGIPALVVLAESIRFGASAGAPAVPDETGEPT